MKNTSHMTKILTLIFFYFQGVICHLSIDIRIEIHFFVCIGKWKANKKSVLQSLNVSKSYSLCGLFAVRCLKICTVSMYIFLARKYASFGHSAYCRNHYERLSHLTEKYGKSLPKILSIFTCGQHKFSPNVLIWSIYLSIMKTTGW